LFRKGSGYYIFYAKTKKTAKNRSSAKTKILYKETREMHKLFEKRVQNPKN